MTLAQLRYTIEIAKAGSMNEAAKSLYISQPSLTNAIHELEKEMNIIIFNRTNKGITLSKEGDDFLGYARQVLEQAAILEDKYKHTPGGKKNFCVSTQHYSFAVNAFVDLIKKYDADQYSFIIRETQTGEIIEDVSDGKSEIGVIYLSEHNEEVISKLIKNNNLVFEEMYVAGPHVFISNNHPLAEKEIIATDDLQAYPYLVYEQGNKNSFYFSEEFMSMLDFPKNIQVRDRATLFNLVIGLNGFTVSSGVLDAELNGSSIIAKPLAVDKTMRIGIVKKKNMVLSKYACFYVEALKNHLSID